MSDELKLLPCAHCGGEEIAGRAWDERLERELYHVTCTACHCRTRNYDTMADAATAWNRRDAARPRWPQGDEAAAVLARLNEVSQ